MELASKFTSRTKALILNTPNNPLGKVLRNLLLGTLPDWAQVPTLLLNCCLGASVSSSGVGGLPVVSCEVEAPGVPGAVVPGEGLTAGGGVGWVPPYLCPRTLRQ